MSSDLHCWRGRASFTLHLDISLSSELCIIIYCFSSVHKYLPWWIVLMYPMLVCVYSCLPWPPSFSPCSWSTTAPSPLSIETLSPTSSLSYSASSAASSSFRYNGSYCILIKFNVYLFKSTSMFILSTYGAVNHSSAVFFRASWCLALLMFDFTVITVCILRQSIILQVMLLC